MIDIEKAPLTRNLKRFSTRKLDKGILTQMLSQQFVDRRSSFQDAKRDCPDQNYAPFYLAKEPKEDAAPFSDSETAQKTKESAKLSSEAILRMAGWIQSMRSRSSRKDYRAFVRQLLGWVGNEAQKYLEIAKAFGDFDFPKLGALEPFTILRLRTKKYAPVVARLRDEVSITQLRVQELIEEVLPKKPRKPKPVAADGNAVLQKHANTSDGSFYFTLKEANLSSTIGSWLENKLESKTFGQVLCEAMEQQNSEEQINAMRQQIEAEAQQQARNRFEMLEFALKREIADLKAQLLQSATSSSGLVEKIPAITVHQDAVAPEPIESAIGLKPSDDEEVPLASSQLNKDLDVQVAPLASIQPSESECAPTEIDRDYLEPVAEPNPQPSDNSATCKQILAADWDLIQELRDAESSLRKIDQKIQGLNSQLAHSGSNVVERELQQLRSRKVSEIVDLINSNGISAYYEEQPHSCRVVLDPKYASDLLLQAQSWSDVVLISGSDCAQLINAVREWSKESKQLLVQLLSSHLETEPLAFNQIDWIPEKLLGRALSTLSFTVQRIKKSDNLVDEPEMEYLTACQFSSLSNLGTRREQWVFHFEGNFIPVFGRSEFTVEKF